MMPGMIMLWYGSIATIPSGWTLCDGSLGTPDLTDEFVLGAGGSKAPGTTGGSGTHKHGFTGDGHAHDLQSGEEIVDDTPNGHHAHSTNVAAATGDTDWSAGSSAYPPWTALCYIMKL